MEMHISNALTFLCSLLQPLDILNVQFLHLRLGFFVPCTCRCLMNLPSTLTRPIHSAKVSNYYVICNSYLKPYYRLYLPELVSCFFNGVGLLSNVLEKYHTKTLCVESEFAVKHFP